MSDSTSTQSGDAVGILPMAGRATRLPGLQCSKEILPLGGPAAAADAAQPARVVCEHILDNLRQAGVHEVYLVIRDGKWDIPTHLGDGSRHGLNLAYLMMGLPWGTPYSIDQAFPFVRGRRVVLGFPDMCFETTDIVAHALDYQTQTGADVVLGVFPADRPHKVDMLRIDADGRVREIVIKPKETRLTQTWGVAVWTPAFTEYLHRFLAQHRRQAEHAPELFVGDVVRAAIEAGMDVRGVEVSARPYVDIGTLEDLARLRGDEADNAR